MKTVKIKFTDFWPGFDESNNDFINNLRNHFDVILSNSPEYVFYSCFGYEHLKYDCIRIFYAGECQSPDFNECDYAIGFDRLILGDRYLRLPIYMIGDYKQPYLSLVKREFDPEKIMKEKTEFCSFVCSNCFAEEYRTEFFNKLSRYKLVNSGGRYLNNVGGPVKDKLSFQMKHKFSMAFENTRYPGYVTEKLMQSFEACTIPIYFGAPDAELDFNNAAFINCNDYESFDDAIEQIKQIDSNDEIYLEMLDKKPVLSPQDPKALEKFLVDIFSQDICIAYRRPRNKYASQAQEIIKRHLWYEKSIHKINNGLKNKIKKKKKGII